MAERRRWLPGFKRDAVGLVRSSGRPLAEIARELGVGESSLAYWVAKGRKARQTADPERFAAETAESEEIKRLRKRVAELETEREILPAP
jgi:transposase